MADDASQIADAFKAAGEALVGLGHLLEKHGMNGIIGKKEQPLSRRKRVIKDKNAPKKNYSSYLHFCDQQRPQLQKEHPTFSQPELAKLLGEKWNGLSTEDKEPYQKAANEDKERYDQEMAKYTPHTSKIFTAVAKKVKSKSAPTKPAATAADADADADTDTDTATSAPDHTANNTASTTEATPDDKDKKRKKKKKKKTHRSKE